MNTGSDPASSPSSGATSATSVSDGRLRTTPIAPSAPCSVISTTERAKFGSTSAGEAISSWPRSESVFALGVRPSGLILPGR